MSKAIPVLLALLLLASCGGDDGKDETTDGADTGLCPQAKVVDHCFVPGGDCTGMITHWIGKARTQILVQAYSFTSEPIALALVEAKERGVEVRVVLDKSQPHAKGNQIHTMLDANIPVKIEHMPGIAHNKIMIIDSEWVETGSFNYTDSAQRRNAENALVFSGCGVDDYQRNWHKNATKAKAYRDEEE